MDDEATKSEAVAAAGADAVAAAKVKQPPPHEQRPADEIDSKTDYAELRQSLRKSFNERQLAGSSYEWRINQLKQLRKMVLENEDKWTTALQKDLGRDKRESFLLEVMQMQLEIDMAIANLKNWMKPEKQTSHLLTQPASTYIYPEPLGVCLIISPWNYPVSLLVIPLIGAIAGGNNVLLKPSEVSANVSKVFEELVPKYLDPECFPVRVAHVEETTRILEQKWDLIFFTGSTHVGRIVMQAAAKHLTPVVLELGGKSPAWVSKDCDVATTARRLAWGKFMNCGQTCVAPDYVLVDPNIEEELIENIKKYTDEMFGEDTKSSGAYDRLITQRRIDQLTRLLEHDGANEEGGAAKFKVEWGGLETVDKEDRYFPPTILRDVNPDCALMQEEIFGPILPIMKCESLDKAIEFINDKPKPLALYAFTSNSKDAEKILRQTSSGGVTVNDTIIHVASPLLQFGGVGDSGQGVYHGKHSFDAFTHRKPVIWKTGAMFEARNPRYPPFTDSKENQARRVLQMTQCTIL